MTDKELEKFIDKALAEYKKEMLNLHAIPLLLMITEMDTKDSRVMQLCSRSIPCEEMMDCLKKAINNCRSEMLRESVQERRN